MEKEKKPRAEPRKVWETPRVVSVERIPEVLGACLIGGTVKTDQARTCTMGTGARGRCNFGAGVIPG